MPRVALTTPTVSIGLPVRNGENYLDSAITSLRNQTFEDLELILCDNGSTDRTEEICRTHAAEDPRISYHRNSDNLGGAANFEKAFHLARAPYFKWAAHDDLCHPELVEKCVRVLDADPSVTLCYSWTDQIDAEGKLKRRKAPRPRFSDPRPSARFAEAARGKDTCPFWGLMRADVLRETRLLARFPGSDRVLLAELALRGRVHEIPEVLFYHRDHSERSVYVLPASQPHQHLLWYVPDAADKLIFPFWRRLGGYLSAIRRAPIPPAESWRCYREIAGWVWHRRRLQLLADDLMIAARYLLGMRKFKTDREDRS